MGRKLDLVRAQDHRLATLDELAQDGVVQQLVGDHGIDSRKGIVHQVHVTVLVGGAGKGQAGSLATTQVDPIAADLGRVAAWQLVQVGLKGARLNDLVIALFLSCKTYKFHYYIFIIIYVECFSKEDVVAERAVDDPGLLGHVRNGAVEARLARGRSLDEIEVAQDRPQKRAVQKKIK